MFNFITSYQIRELVKISYSIIDRMRGYPSQKKMFYETHGYHLDLQNPKTFNEKIVWKKINDRNPLLPITSDKYCVREYLVKQLGEEDAKAIQIPLLYITDDPKSIPFDRLPERYIIKSNHGSGQALIINEKTTYTNEEITRICANWVRKSYGLMKHEWAYQKIKRKIVIEELLVEEDGSIPKDFKFYVFHGKCEMVMVIFDRIIGPTRTLYTSEWEMIPVTYIGEQGKSISKPPTYNRMFRLAELLGKNFAFVRIDLYSIQDKIYFGEMTHYPMSGMGKFTPQSYDETLGQKWKLELEY